MSRFWLNEAVRSCRRSWSALRRLSRLDRGTLVGGLVDRPLECRLLRRAGPPLLGPGEDGAGEYAMACRRGYTSWLAMESKRSGYLEWMRGGGMREE